MSKPVDVNAILLQDDPSHIVSAAIRGKWLLEHCTPSWRMHDPKKGFQRIVREERARQIAIAVLDQNRTFPNSIVLATNQPRVPITAGKLHLAANTKLLVVDGQHRLWAQTFSNHDALYSCVVHFGLTERQMAELFLEINDTQKRVPSSLRWDLVRLVRPDDDPAGIAAAELVYELATSETSPLFQRIDLTGEQGQIVLKQGSLAPELKTLANSKRAGFKDLDFGQQYECLIRFLAALQSRDPDGWRSGTSPLLKARVLRALIRLIPDIAIHEKKPPHEVPPSRYLASFQRINLASLDSEQIRAAQGSAGMKEIQGTIKLQMGL